jgi:hypothetical protein
MPAPKPIATPLEQLALVPLRNAKVRVLEDLPGCVRLEVDAVYPRWLGPLPRLLKARAEHRYTLDGTALQVWRQVDDRRTLGELCDWFAADQQLPFNEARLLLLSFLRSLSLKGLIVLGDRTLVEGG